MWQFKKKKQPESTNWLNEASKDFESFKSEVLPRLRELNQKWFKKDVGFNLINGRNGDQLCFTTDIEGLGLIKEFFFASIRRDVLLYLKDCTASDAIDFCDSLKESLLKEIYIK